MQTYSSLSTTTEVVRGQTGITVELTVSNIGGEKAQITEATLTFGNSTSGYTQAPDPDNPASIAADLDRVTLDGRLSFVAIAAQDTPPSLFVVASSPTTTVTGEDFTPGDTGANPRSLRLRVG